MSQKAVIISGIIGLIFGFLFAGTLGINFFGSNDNDNDEVRTDLKKDAEGFKLAYNLDESIYLPIYGSDFYEKLENDETFILYIGRDTCPYCQQFVPGLMEAAENQNFTVIYHVDTIDSNNTTFVRDEGVTATPTTYFVKNGVIVEIVIGYINTEDVELIIVNTLS